MTTQPQTETPDTRPPAPRALTLASADGGSGVHPVFKVGAALVLVLAIIGAYVYFNEQPPPVVGEVLHLTAYPVHRESKANQFASQSIAPVDSKFDEIIVLADVRLRNRSDGPVFLADMTATLKLPTEEDRSTAATATDFHRVFLAYPALSPMKQQPLLRDITIPAGATQQGQLVFNYPIAKEAWDQRQSLDLTLSFTHQKDLVLPAPL